MFRRYKKLTGRLKPRGYKAARGFLRKNSGGHLRKRYRNRVLMLLILTAIPLGMAVGSVYGQSGFMDSYLQMGLFPADKTVMFQEGLLKHGKLIVLIWFMAFVPAGSLIAAGFIYARIFACGFTAAVMIKIYRAYTGANTFLPFLPYASQLMIISIYMHMAYRCADYLASVSRGDEKELVNYFLVLIIGLVFAAAASSIDMLLVPVIRACLVSPF